LKLSLVIPCFNEAKSIPALAERCRLLTANQPDCEVILVDNGSTDDSPAVMAAVLAGMDRLRSIRVPVNRGYGFGILSGLAAASGDILGWTHADLQTDPMDALRGFERFKAGADPARLFVKGARFGRPVSDAAFTFGMSVFETILLRRPLRDINAQPTLFPRGLFESWRAPPDDFALDLYAYVSAKASGLRVERFPVRFGERVHGVSHWNVDWRSKVKFIRRTMDYSLRLQRELAAAGGSGS
jgi:glycosyltransferase involved in cell wall biosynthesis